MKKTAILALAFLLGFGFLAACGGGGGGGGSSSGAASEVAMRVLVVVSAAHQYVAGARVRLEVVDTNGRTLYQREGTTGSDGSARFSFSDAEMEKAGTTVTLRATASYKGKRGSAEVVARKGEVPNYSIFVRL